VEQQVDRSRKQIYTAECLKDIQLLTGCRMVQSSPQRSEDYLRPAGTKASLLLEKFKAPKFQTIPFREDTNRCG
jgi:hypothetical protein